MRRARFPFALIVLLAVLGTAALDAAELTGRVVGVTDGDTYPANTATHTVNDQANRDRCT